MPSINEVLRKHAEYGDSGLLSAVEELARHGHVAEYLFELTQRHVSPDEPIIAYRHPNGFTKIKLTPLSDIGWCVRLHVWDAGATDGDIHDHRWHFASYVASGSIVERCYEVSPGVGRSVMFNCSPSLDGSYVLTGGRPCDARLTAEDVHHSGSSYHRDPATLHQPVATVGSPAVTLLVQGSAVKCSTTVVRKCADAVNPVLTSRFSASEVLDELCTAFGLIANA